MYFVVFGVWNIGFDCSDNCLNNTLQVANVLLSEGIDPTVPLYLATGLSTEGLATFRALNGARFATDSLFGLYTIVTADMVASWDHTAVPSALSATTFWTAVNFVVGQDGQMFIGNSVSHFSALLMIARRRGRKLSLHYNGGNVPLQDSKQLSPKKDLAVQTFRTPIKWVFCAQPNATSRQATHTFMNMTKVAVKSALEKTSLVPVGVTTADPRSDFAKFLVSLGVRVIYHTPSWAQHIASMVSRWKGEKESSRFARGKRSHLLYNAEAMIGTFLRIDVPILGILDEFVLYTDTDVLFMGDVEWKSILRKRYQRFVNSNDFARGVQRLANPGEIGVPRYFSMSSEFSRDTTAMDYNAGIMLLKLGHEDCISFVGDSPK
eukprot:s5672_g2.t1